MKFFFFLSFKYDQAILSYNEALQIVDTNSHLWSDIISNLAGIYIFIFNNYLYF
jgi:hypothetical protein